MKQQRIHVLLAVDDEASGKAIVEAFNQASYSVKGAMATSPGTLMKGLKTNQWQAVVCNFGNQQFSLQEISALIRSSSPRIPLFAFIAAEDYSIENRLTAMKAGAVDLIPKEHPELLSLIIQRELARLTSSSSKGASQKNHATELSEEEALWQQRLESALENNRFITAFQPIVHLNAEPAENYEVLLRMLDENDQEILPGSFISVAEKSGLMLKIDRWIIQHTLTTIKERQQGGATTCFFIKLSQASLCDDSFPAWLSEALHQASTPEYSLVFEISEALALQHNEKTKTLIKHLHQLKCLTALDHVGSDNSEDITWTNFELDYIKIAGRLIRDVASNEQSQKAVTYIASHAKAHKIKTIAQFVQDTTSLTFLYQRSINYIQGYYLQRPDIALNYNFSDDE